MKKTGIETKLLTTTAAAKLLGITHQSFSKGVKSGRFSVAERKASGRNLFDAETVKKEYAATRDLAEAQDHARFFRGGRRGSQNEIDAKKMLFMKYRKEAAQAKAIEFKLKVQRSEYIPKDTARQQGVELGTIVMGFLDAWPSKLSPALKGMADAGSDEHDFRCFLENEVQALIRAIRAKCGIVDD